MDGGKGANLESHFRGLKLKDKKQPYSYANCEKVEGDYITKIFSKGQKITAVDVHKLYLAIGTDSGNLYLMNHRGGAFDENILCFIHDSKITSIKIEKKSAQFIISCGWDNKLVITDIYKNEVLYSENLGFKPSSLAIAPNFIDDERLVIGGDIVTFHELALLKKKKTVLLENETTNETDVFRYVSWNGNMIGITSGNWTRLINSTTFETHCVVHSEEINYSYSTPATHVWLPNDALIVGWGEIVSFIKFKESEFPEGVECESRLFVKPITISGVSIELNTKNEFEEFLVVGLAHTGTEDDNSRNLVAAAYRKLPTNLFQLKRVFKISNSLFPPATKPSDIHVVNFANFFYIFAPGKVVKVVKNQRM